VTSSAEVSRLENVTSLPDYRYELRRGDEVIATRHLSREQPLEVGERMTIGSRTGIVRDVEPLLGEHELRLVVQLTSILARSLGYSRSSLPPRCC
jgi:hypothetical protein